MQVRGKYAEARIFAQDVDPGAREQIKNFLDHPAFDGAKVRIMPDVHAGKGAVIGFTAPLSDKVIPNVVGVDIGCGVSAWALPSPPDCARLDAYVRKHIPCGHGVHASPAAGIEAVYESLNVKRSHATFINRVKDICREQHQDHERVIRSLGSLGGGNHFIEVDADEDGQHWLIIHSGSRNFGLKIAGWHQDIAVQLCGRQGGMEWLDGEQAKAYCADMQTAQLYARLNRHLMGYILLKGFFNLRPARVEAVESVHNYISFEDDIIRKGAISAHHGERVIIPLHMAAGCVLGEGLGNGDWNYSAPHGAGRRMSRSQARKKISLHDFSHDMKQAGVWSSCIGKNTLDEAPDAYKNPGVILKEMAPTVRITNRLKPVYNFKG